MPRRTAGRVLGDGRRARAPLTRPDPGIPDDAVPLTVEDVARRCRVSVRTVRRWIAAGDLPVLRLGRAVRVRKRALAAFLRRAAGE